MSAYDDIAEWYDHWVGTHSMREDPFFPAVEAFIGEVAGQRICDLACGQGRVARHLADLGARRHEETEPRGIEYLQAERLAVGAAGVGLFDSVVCCMALMDIPDLAPTLHSVARILMRRQSNGPNMYLYEKAREAHCQDLRREAEKSCLLALLPGPRRSMSRHIAGKLSILLLKLGAWLQRFEQSQPTLKDPV